MGGTENRLGASLLRLPGMCHLAALLLAFLASPAAAGVLRVSPGERFRVPSQAAAVARPGDTVLIAAGRYRDCAVWRAADLLIAAEGGEAEITGPVCDGKALFVVAAPRITVRGLGSRCCTSR